MTLLMLQLDFLMERNSPVVGSGPGRIEPHKGRPLRLHELRLCPGLPQTRECHILDSISWVLQVLLKLVILIPGQQRINIQDGGCPGQLSSLSRRGGTV